MTYVETSQENFRLVFTMVREHNAHVAEATSDFAYPSRSAPTRYFLDESAPDERGISGYAVRPSGELVYVFSLTRDSNGDRVPSNGDRLVTDAVDNGATHLDCFDGYLPRLYSRNGFAVVTRERNYRPGGPDVVYMQTVDGMLANGWTVDSAFNHRDGVCDQYICTADHTYDYSTKG